MGNFFSNDDKKQDINQNLGFLVGLQRKQIPDKSIIDSDTIRHLMSDSPVSQMGTEIHSVKATSANQYSPTSSERYSTQTDHLTDTLAANIAIPSLEGTFTGGFDTELSYKNNNFINSNELTDISASSSGFKMLQSIVKKDISQNGGCPCSSSNKTTENDVSAMVGGKKDKKNKKQNLDIVEDEFDIEDDLDEDTDDTIDDEFDELDDDEDFDDLDSFASSEQHNKKQTRQARSRKNTDRSRMGRPSKTKKSKHSNKYEETSQDGGDDDYKIDTKYFYSSEVSNNIYGSDGLSENYNRFRYRNY